MLQILSRYILLLIVIVGAVWLAPGIYSLGEMSGAFMGNFLEGDNDTLSLFRTSNKNNYPNQIAVVFILNGLVFFSTILIPSFIIPLLIARGRITDFVSTTGWAWKASITTLMLLSAVYFLGILFNGGGDFIVTVIVMSMIMFAFLTLFVLVIMGVARILEEAFSCTQNDAPSQEETS